MKKLIPFIGVMLAFLTTSLSQTAGQLDVTVNTSHAGGNYKPKNILAIWVENEQGDFIKTLLARADKRKTHLNTWQASTDAAGTEYNTVDAITGATLNSHGTRTCAWNGEDYNGNLVSDGTYKLWMELTDKNATGNYSAFEFIKNNMTQSYSPDNKPSFSAIQFNWTPDPVSDVEESMADRPCYLKFNPVRERVVFSKMPEGKFRIFNLSGECVYMGKAQSVDVVDLPPGIYIVVFANGQNTLRFLKV